MKSRLYTALLSLLFFYMQSGVHAQPIKKKYTITGAVIDSLTQKNLDGAVVAFMMQPEGNANIFLRVLTNREGAFAHVIEVPDTATAIFIQVTAVKFQKTSLKIPLAKTVINLPALRLAPMAIVQEGAVIVGSRATVDVEKLNFDVNSKDFSPNTKLVEVLRQVPLLSVDENANIKILGRVQPVVFMNGKEISREVLNSLTHEMISRIEVISSPSAKYAGEIDGVVNIITKKIKSDVLKGSLSAGVGSINPFYNASASLIYKKNRFLMLSSFSVLTNTQVSDFNVNRYGAGVRLDQAAYSNFKPVQGGAHLTLFYDVDSTKNLNLLINSSFIKENRSQRSVTDYYTNIAHHNTVNFADRHRSIFTTNAEAEYKKTYSRHAAFLVVGGRFMARSLQREIDFDEEPYGGGSRQKNRSLDRSWYYEKTFNITYASNVLKRSKGRLETGLTTAFRKTDGTYAYYNYMAGEYIISPFSPQHTLFVQNVYAGYFSLRFAVKKVNFLAGLRTEITDNEVALIDSSFSKKNTTVNLLPSLSISREFNNKITGRVSYNRRIRRPGWYYLNPFVFTESGIDNFSGNPGLEPEIRDRVEVSLSKNLKKNVFFFASMYFSKTRNIIYEVTENNSTNGLFERRYANLGSEYIAGTSVSVTAPLSKNTNINTSVYVEYDNISARHSSLRVSENDLVIAGGSVNLTTKIAKHYAFSFFISYTSRSIELQSRSVLYPLTDMSIRRNFFKDKLSFTIRYQDIFNNGTNRRNIYYDGLFYQNSRVKSRISNIIATVQYNFGKNFNSNKRRTGIPLDDVKTDPR